MHVASAPSGGNGVLETTFGAARKAGVTAAKPPGQTHRVAFLPALVRPPPHSKHCVPARNVPGRHDTHASGDVSPRYWIASPYAQFVQSVLASPGAYLPAAQSVHVPLSNADPALHG